MNRVKKGRYGLTSPSERAKENEPEQRVLVPAIWGWVAAYPLVNMLGNPNVGPYPFSTAIKMRSTPNSRGRVSEPSIRESICISWPPMVGLPAFL